MVGGIDRGRVTCRFHVQSAEEKIQTLQNPYTAFCVFCEIHYSVLTREKSNFCAHVAHREHHTPSVNCVLTRDSSSSSSCEDEGHTARGQKRGSDLVFMVQCPDAD